MPLHRLGCRFGSGVKVVFDLTLGHPPDRVWPYLAVLEKRAEFVPQLDEMTRIGTGPVGVGAEWRSVGRMGPWKVSAIDTLTSYEPLSRVGWDTSEPWNARTEYQLTPLDEGSTVIHMAFEADPSGWLRIMDWVPDSMLKRAMISDHRRLEAILDDQR